jgi:hypothetical protein
MEIDKFNEVVNQRCEKMKNVLSSKGNEYARGDRLSNFKKGSSALTQTPEEFCVELWMKHVISIIDFVQDIGKGKFPTRELMDEKITDGINYLVLLEGLIYDRFEVK